MTTDTKRARSLNELLTSGQVTPVTRRISPKEKEQMAANGDVFTITHVAQGSDQEDRNFWQFDIELDGYPAQFRLSSKPGVDGMYESLAFAAAEGPITGCVLVEKSRKNDNAFLVIEQAQA